MTAHELTGGSAALGSPSERACTISTKACHPERSARVVEGSTHLPFVQALSNRGSAKIPPLRFTPVGMTYLGSLCAVFWLVVSITFRRSSSVSPDGDPPSPRGEGFAACRRWQGVRRCGGFRSCGGYRFFTVIAKERSDCGNPFSLGILPCNESGDPPKVLDDCQCSRLEMVCGHWPQNPSSEGRVCRSSVTERVRAVTNRNAPAHALSARTAGKKSRNR